MELVFVFLLIIFTFLSDVFDFLFEKLGFSESEKLEKEIFFNNL